MKVVFSTEAEHDLDSIAIYTEEVWGEAQCDRYIALLEDTALHVLPTTAYLRELDTHPGVYRFRTERHYLYFTRTEDTLTVVRILHDSMEPERHL